MGPLGGQRQRERASPRGDQRLPRPDTRSCRLLSFQRACPLHPVLPRSKATSQSRQRRFQRYGPELGQPLPPSVFLVVLNSLKSQSFILSSQQTPAASPLLDISLMYRQASETRYAPLQTCYSSSLPPPLCIGASEPQLLRQNI